MALAITVLAGRNCQVVVIALFGSALGIEVQPTPLATADDVIE